MATQVNSLGLEKGLKVFFEDTVADQTAPSITFENNSTTGVYFNSTDTSVNLSISGTTVSKFTGTRIGILSGVNAPRASVDLGYTTDSLILPSGTTAQRLSVTPGSLRYNNENNILELRNDNSWNTVLSGNTIGTGSFVLNNSPTFTGTVTLPTNTTIGAVSSTEISYLDGVTSSIQTQLNNKADISSVTTEVIQDAAATLLTNGIHNGIYFVYNDADNRLDGVVDPLLRPNAIPLASNTIDCSISDTFSRTISSNSTFAFINAPTGKGFTFLLRLTLTASVTVTWPINVEWSGGSAPTISNNTVNIFGFFTDDGGITWYGNAMTNYL